MQVCHLTLATAPSVSGIIMVVKLLWGLLAACGADRRDLEIRNTMSVHMWAITATADAAKTSCSFAFGWLAGGASLALIVAQIGLLWWVVYETLHPTCYVHSDCRVGEYCQLVQGFPTGMSYRPGLPRCGDCVLTYYYGVNESFCEGVLAGASASDLDLFGETRDLATVMCHAQRHCIATDTSVTRCDYLVHAKQTRTPAVVGLLLFAAALLVVPLSTSMDDVTIEHALLDWTRRRAPQSTSFRLFHPTHLVGLSLGLRRFFLPACVTLVCACWLLTQALSALHILLIILCVKVVCEADTMLASMLLSPAARTAVSLRRNRCATEPRGLPSARPTSMPTLPAHLASSSCARVSQASPLIDEMRRLGGPR